MPDERTDSALHFVRGKASRLSSSTFGVIFPEVYHFPPSTWGWVHLRALASCLGIETSPVEVWRECVRVTVAVPLLISDGDAVWYRLIDASGRIADFVSQSPQYAFGSNRKFVFRVRSGDIYIPVGLAQKIRAKYPCPTN